MEDNDVLDLFVKNGLVNLPEIYQKAPWYVTFNHELHFNTEENKKDLINGDGATYSGCIQFEQSLDDYTIFEIDSGCGWNYQIILSNENQVKL